MKKRTCTSGLILLIPLILSILFIGVSVSAVSAQTASSFGGFLSQAPSDSALLEIAQVDDIRLTPPFSPADSTRLAEHKPIETGWKATVQGTISSREFQVFVLVHALLSDTWIVQSSVSRPSKTGTWRTTCFLGAERKGQDDDYEIIAVAALKRDQYHTGQRIPANQFPPPDIPQSDTVHVRRIRSPNP